MRESCIWCGCMDEEAPPEHIIPECLGCPPEREECILITLELDFADLVDYGHWTLAARHGGEPHPARR